MKTWMLPLMVASLTFSVAAYAADDGSMSGDMDKKMDNMDEMGMKGPSFEKMDANGDGMISSDELNVYGSSAAGNAADSKAERSMMRIEKHDMDGDGNISREEFDKAVEDAQ